MLSFVSMMVTSRIAAEMVPGTFSEVAIKQGVKHSIGRHQKE